MRTVGSVIASVSRKAGGLFESVRNLSLAIDRDGRYTNAIYGLEDEYTAADVGAWSPLDVHLHKVYGPKQVGYAPSLAKSLSASKPQVIHNHGIWMYPSSAVSRASKNLNVPFVVSPHGMLDPWAVKHSRWKKMIAMNAFEAGHLKGASCIRALCESEANAVRSFGLKNPVCIIPNGIDLPNAAPTERPVSLAHVPTEKQVLLYLGRLHPKKGLSNLLKAWASYHAADWQLVIAGWDQGDHEAELRTLVAKMALHQSVSFVGPQFGEAKRALYQHSNAFILPSFSEGLPMVVLEAWSHNLPVVMTQECNLPKGFSSRAAIRIETNEESIRSGIRELMTMTLTARVEMGQNGRKLTEQEFTWCSIARDMGDVYDWLLGGQRPACVRLD